MPTRSLGMVKAEKQVKNPSLLEQIQMMEENIERLVPLWNEDETLQMEITLEEWKEIIDTELQSVDLNSSNKIKIIVSNRQIHYAIGYRQINKERLISRGYNVRFERNPSFSQYQLNIG